MNEARIFRLLIMPLLGPRGTGPLIFSFSLLMNGYFWDSEQAGWIRPGLPPLCMMTGPFSIFEVPFGRPGNIKQLLICSNGKGFGVFFGFDVHGSHHLLVSSHLRERDKMLLRAILSFLVEFGIGKIEKEDVPCRFCGAPNNDGHLFWDCTFPPFVELCHQPEFLMSKDRTRWQRCLLWHGWLPGLSSRALGTLCLETAFGSSHKHGLF